MSSLEEELEHMSLEDELVEYLIQRRESDLNKLTPKSKFKINLNEHPVLGKLLEYEKTKFRTTVRKVILRAFSNYKFDSDRADLIRKTKEVFEDIQLEIKIPKSVEIENIRAEKHEGRIITFPAEVLLVGEAETITTRFLFRCPECHDEQTYPPNSGAHACARCHGNMRNEGVAESETVQTINLKDMNSADSTTTIFTADVHREQAGNIGLNEKVMVTGLFKSIPPTSRTKHKNEILIEIINLEPLDEDKTVKPDPLTLQNYKDLAKHGKLIDKLIDSFAWHVEGNRNEKLACILYLTGGVDTELYRGRIHIGFIGDPATGKTEIAKWIKRITPNSGITDGTGSSGVGLGVGMVKLPNGTSGMVSGPLVRHNKGFVFIDELDKMEKSQYEMLLGIMNDGLCRRTLAGVDIELQAKTSLLACANPIGGKWDMDNPSIGSNINLSAPLLSRFDLLFRFLQIADRERDLRISRHIQKSRQGRPNNILSEEELTAFFNEVRDSKPKLTPESEEILIQFYIKREEFQLSRDSISMDQRQYGALIRIAYAFGKLLFKHTVDEECVNLAINIYKKSVESFGISLESGGSTAEGSKFFTNPKEGRDRAFRTIFKHLQDKNEMVFREELVEAMQAQKQWKSSDHAHSFINLMHSKAIIIEKATGELKLVD